MDPRRELDTVYRAEYGRCVATLVRLLGDINLAEEAVQDAFAVALEKWATLPPNPGAWIVTTARNRAIDRLRRESTREARHAQALPLHHREQTEEVGPVSDEDPGHRHPVPGARLLPTPVVALNRAVAVAEVHGPALALAALQDVDLPGYHLLPATRADLLTRLGRAADAAAAYDQAIELAGNDTERAFLRSRRAGLRAPGQIGSDSA